MSRRQPEQELASGLNYEPLPSLPEAEPDVETPILVGGESYEWAAISNLDLFFTRIYRYWQDKGFATILLSRLLNIAALAFTIAFSGFLLLAVDWRALHADCIVADTCDIAAAALHPHPLAAHGALWAGLVLAYLSIFGVFWLWTVAHFVADLRDLLEVKHFVNYKLGISERQVKMMTWSELVQRIVLLQRTTRLCIVRDLSELDIVGRIMRKDNYLIGMLNRGVLALHVPLPFSRRRRFMLTKTLEWNLRWAVLEHMFDERFHVRADFCGEAGEAALRARLRRLAAANLLLAPFLLVFLLIYFFMRNAERFYHHPGSLGARRWTSLARWRLRELNELPHYVAHRLDASHAAAVQYVNQFPNTATHHAAKFVAFVTGSFAALLLLLTLLDEGLLERRLLGRHVVWWLATLGIVLTLSRSFVSEEPAAADPEAAMAEIVVHTHHLPRHWRGRAHTAEVQQQFSALFRLKVAGLLEEMASVLLTPYVLLAALPPCAPAITAFVRDFTARVDGVGDICSLAAFDFGRHGNSKYGAPAHCAKPARSRQGKMEKSFLTFAATYPGWDPCAGGRAMLGALSAASVDPAASTAPPSLLGASGAPPGQAAAAAQHPQLSVFLQRSALAGALPERLLRQQQEMYAAAWGQAAAMHSQAGPYIPGMALPPPLPPPIRPSTHYPRGHPLQLGRWPLAASGAQPVGGGSIFGASELAAGAASTPAAGLPGHEPDDLPQRLQAGHALLQSYYELRDDTVQQRLAHRAHSRSVMLLSPRQLL